MGGWLMGQGSMPPPVDSPRPRSGKLAARPRSREPSVRTHAATQTARQTERQREGGGWYLDEECQLFAQRRSAAVAHEGQIVSANGNGGQLPCRAFQLRT